MRRTMNSMSLFAFALALLGATVVVGQEPELAEAAEAADGPIRAEAPDAASVEPNIIHDVSEAPIAGGIGEGVVLDGSVGHIHDGPCGNGGVNCFPRPGRNPDLFYNYYLPPGCGVVGSDLYLSPGEVPRHVGHTYITYQPLMPHEFLYPHHRTYYQYYDGGRGLNRTHVKYYQAPLRRVGYGLHTFKIAR